MIACDFAHNTARFGGVGYVRTSSGTTSFLSIMGTQFRNNTAVWSGGVVYVYLTRQAMLKLTITQSKFIHNMANGYSDDFFHPNEGGGVVDIYMSGTSQTAVVVNISGESVFENNAAVSHGGVLAAFFD